MRTTPQFLPDLPFGSYLVYPSPPQTTDAEQKAKSHVIGLKNDSARSPDARYTLIGYTLRLLAQAVPGSVLSQLLNRELTLVPMPRRGILQKNSVWAPLTMAEVMVSLGLGAEVMPIVRRTVASPKSAFADPARRPEPLDHYNSMAVDRPMLLPRRVLLVDDVVTRGATFSGAAARLLEIDPNLEIHAFGLARAHTPFVTAVDPCIGSIVTDPDGLRCRRHDTPQSP